MTSTFDNAESPLPESPVNTAPPDWMQQLDPGLRPVAQAKGWQSSNDALRSYVHLERMLGNDKIALPGKDAQDGDWDRVWEKLGRPQKPDGYSFSAPDDLKDIYDSAFADWFKASAHKAGLSAKQAGALHDAYLDFARAQMQNQPQTGGMDAAEETLRAEWGGQYDRKLNAGRRAALAFASTPEEVEALEQAIGSTQALRLLSRIGEAMTEDSIAGDGKLTAMPTLEEAQSELKKMRDGAYRDPRHPLMNKLHPDHQKMNARMQALYAILAAHEAEQRHT